MLGMNVSTRTMVICLLLLVASPAMAGYTIQWEARDDGHLSLWWTVNGEQLSPDPFVDNDMADGETVQGIAPTDAVNDCHEQWAGANGATSETHIVCGYPQPTPTFDETLAPHGDAVMWLSLADAAGVYDVFIDISLPSWATFLDTHPLPDVTGTFLFGSDGYCAELPGYYAMDAVTGATYQGEMTVVGVATLITPEPTAIAMFAAGVLTLLRRRS